MVTCSVRYEVIVNDEKFHESCHWFTIEDSLPEEKIININWDNLSEIYYNYGTVMGFNIWNGRHGKRICWFNLPANDDIKERKIKNLNMKLHITYKETKVSINDILKYNDADLAVKYLIEKGLSINLK